MPNPPKILAFAGSARRDSLNKKLLHVVVEATRAAGGEVTVIDLNDLPMPLYHGDLEDREGLPANAQKMVELVLAHDALLIASPEYNSMITPLFKNTIDWCTRADDNPLIGKVAAVVSASPGQFGGVRSMQLARALLTHLGCLVIPAACTVAKADAAFDEEGKLRDPRTQQAAEKVARQLVATTTKLRD